MTDAAQDPLEDIVDSIDIDAPIGTVWRALSEPESVRQWLGCLQYDAKLGQVFYMQPDEARREQGDIEGATHCEVLALEPNDRMEFSWYMPDTPKTLVSIRLVENNPGTTTVLLTHSGWDQFPREAVEDFWQKLKSGWSSFVLPKLKVHAEAQ